MELSPLFILSLLSQQEPKRRSDGFLSIELPLSLWAACPLCIHDTSRRRPRHSFFKHCYMETATQHVPGLPGRVSGPCWAPTWPSLTSCGQVRLFGCHVGHAFWGKVPSSSYLEAIWPILGPSAKLGQGSQQAVIVLFKDHAVTCSMLGPCGLSQGPRPFWGNVGLPRWPRLSISIGHPAAMLG